ncbi:hypothetical protein [Geobacillus subterraneus]|uniref:Uncharacterized protein n=1 Tax=Geobacillus subterraneus TaxID=129338 RepID=A0A679FSB4_9BACL|nr:hypothetical protein [Geobacillus subterraneus]BBW99033.1 hypothetical protein GsuE55_38660 [Geobacillus subterraneus]
MKERLIDYLTRRIIMYSWMIETSKNEVDREKCVVAQKVLKSVLDDVRDGKL